MSNEILYSLRNFKNLELIKSKMKTMDSAPKDRVILVYHDHDADTYQDLDDPTGKCITTYAAWVEGNGHSPNGLYLADFGGGFDEDLSGEGWGPIVSMPDWWFKHDDEDSEYPLNPVLWKDIE
jgi:hypothetical protein